MELPENLKETFALLVPYFDAAGLFFFCLYNTHPRGSQAKKWCLAGVCYLFLH